MFVTFTCGHRIVSISAQAVVAVMDHHNDPGKCLIYVGSTSDDTLFVVDCTREECLQKVNEARFASDKP